jgi:hypothetical protein
MRAKFVCQFIEDWGNKKVVHMMAVYGDSEENKTYSKFTPQGELKITIDQGTSAFDFIQQGKEYYLDFTLVG